MSIPTEPGRTARHDTSEAAGDRCEAIDPATLEGEQAMNVTQATLQRQLQTGELTQDAYDEAYTLLIEATPPAVLKASMAERQEVIKRALAYQPSGAKL